MPRFKMTLEYDGSRYAGWQVQQKDRTVQGALLEAAFQVFETQDLELYGSGRTDAGVHARGQVAHLDVPATRLSPPQILMRLNDLLPHDINVVKVEKTSPHFHARHDARRRTYVYQVSRRRDAFGKKFIWWVRDPLDLQAMRTAARLFEGFHDFRSFGETEHADQSTLVELQKIDISETGDRLLISVTASHFLWKMVRRLVGTLVEVGRGKIAPAQVSAWLENPSREPARLTAPPSGLFLERVEY